MNDMKVDSTPKYPPFQVMKIIGQTEFRPFTRQDWMGYQGCESAEPMIGTYKTYHPETGAIRTGVIILDGAAVGITDDDDSGGGRSYCLEAL